MPTRTTLTIAAVLVPAIRTALDAHDAIVELVERSGADGESLWIGDRWVVRPSLDSHRIGLGGHLTLSGTVDEGDDGARLVLFAGPLELAVEYLGADLVETVAPYSGGRAA